MARAQAKVDWVRVPVDPKLLQELNRTSNWKGCLQAGGHLLLTLMTGAATVAIWATQPWYWTIPALLVHGCVLSMLASGVHELVHERVFTTPILNRIFLAINSFLTSWNYPFFIISHKDHHRYTLNQPHDLEVVLPAAEAISKMKPVTPWQSCVAVSQYFFAWKAIWPATKRHWDFAKGSYPQNDEKGGLWSQVWCEQLFCRMTDAEKRSIRNCSLIYLGGHALITLVSLALGWWIVPLVICLGTFFGGFLSYLTATPQHIGLIDHVNDFRLCCRTYTCSRLVRFLYWNMNYHIEHHMFAAVPCYNLPRLHEAIKKYLPPVHTSLYSTWCEIKLIAHIQRFDPTYKYRQPLPEDLPVNPHLKLARIDDASAKEYLDLAPAPVPVEPIAATARADGDWKLWECCVCGFLYDEALGLPEEGLAPGTRWADIPDDWACPDCGVSKAGFKMTERSRVATAGS